MSQLSNWVISCLFTLRKYRRGIKKKKWKFIDRPSPSEKRKKPILLFIIHLFITDWLLFVENQFFFIGIIFFLYWTMIKSIDVLFIGVNNTYTNEFPYKLVTLLCWDCIKMELQYRRSSDKHKMIVTFYNLLYHFTCAIQLHCCMSIYLSWAYLW